MSLYFLLYKEEKVMSKRKVWVLGFLSVTQASPRYDMMVNNVIFTFDFDKDSVTILKCALENDET